MARDLRSRRSSGQGKGIIGRCENSCFKRPNALKIGWVVEIERKSKKAERQKGGMKERKSPLGDLGVE